MEDDVKISYLALETYMWLLLYASDIYIYRWLNLIYQTFIVIYTWDVTE